MNVIRCTVVDGRGAVSFIVHGDALPALAASCSTNPTSLEEFLEQAEPYYRNLRDYVLSGLAVFEERNVEGNCEAIRAALGSVASHQHPVFRVVDDLTRENLIKREQTKDPWGKEMQISCEGDVVSEVRSSGKDGSMGNDDDISYSESQEEGR